jgi:hypothetical protein
VLKNAIAKLKKIEIFLQKTLFAGSGVNVLPDWEYWECWEYCNWLLLHQRLAAAQP